MPRKPVYAIRISKLMLALSCLFAIRRIHDASSNWHLYLAPEVFSLINAPILAMFGFFVSFLSSIINIIKCDFQDPNNGRNVLADSSLWFELSLGLFFIALHFNIVYEKYFFAKFHFTYFLTVTMIKFILPERFTKFLSNVNEVLSMTSIMVLTYYNQNWHGALGAQLIAVATLWIGPEGTLFGFPAVFGVYFVLVCATYLLSEGVIMLNA